MAEDIKARAAELLKKHQTKAKEEILEQKDETDGSLVSDDTITPDETSSSDKLAKVDIPTATNSPSEKFLTQGEIEQDEVFKKYLSRPFQPWHDPEYVKGFRLLHKIPNILVDTVLPDIFDKEFPGGKYAYTGSIVREHVITWSNGAQTKHKAHYRFIAILIEPPHYQEVTDRRDSQDIHHYFHWTSVIKNNPVYNEWMKLCAYNNIELITHNEIAPLFLALDSLNEPVHQ